MLKVGLIGCGFMGQMHANCYKNIEGVTLAAVADIRKEKAEDIAQGTEATIYGDGMDLIENADLSRVKVVYRKDADGNATVSRCYNESGQIYTNTKQMNYVAVPEELRLGCYRSNVNGTGRFAKGILNDCRIYNVALTDAQIEEYLLS